MTRRKIEFLDVIKYPGNPDDIPESPFPFYIIAREGPYLVKTTSLGRVILPEEMNKKKEFELPYPSMGDWSGGYFRYTADKIPHEIIAQTLSFFRKVWKEMKAEAEIILLQHDVNKDFRIFVPYQVVTGGSVKSIYDSADVPEGYSTIGTIHSHCNFNAFHSSIDTGDAETFNGVHITIGNIDRANPSFAAMVMINGLDFNFKMASSVAEIEGDLEELEAPDEWVEKFVYSNPAAILLMDFKTLTRADLDAFGKASLPRVHDKKDDKVTTPMGFVPFQGVGNYWRKDDKDNYHRPSVRYHNDLHRSYPIEFYTEESYSSTFKDEFIEKVLNNELEELFKFAMKYGIYLEYNLLNVEGIDQTKVEEAIDNILDGDILPDSLLGM